MKFRKFLATLFAPSQPKVNRGNADPLQTAYEDAYVLLEAIYAGEPWSRRAMARRMSQPRHTTACALLRSAEILDSRGRFVFDPNQSKTVAEVMLRGAVSQERHKRNQRNYVPPW